LTHPGVVLPLIVDGVHLAPEAVRLAWQAAPARVALITDAISAAGCGDGEFMLGSVAVSVRDGVARRTSDGILAGSVLTMIDAVRNLHELGVPLAQALGAASAAPSSALGLGRTGRLAPGTTADIVVVGDSLEIERVLVGGETHVAV
jgi:N-acetylglucosamine-6-phosphate deacetylase